MPDYKYTAKDIDGKLVQGVSRAENETQLSANLYKEQLFLIRYKECKNKPEYTSRLSALEIADFSRQIGQMLSSGISLVRVVDIMNLFLNLAICRKKKNF